MCGWGRRGFLLRPCFVFLRDGLEGGESADEFLFSIDRAVEKQTGNCFDIPAVYLYGGVRRLQRLWFFDFSGRIYLLVVCGRFCGIRLVAGDVPGGLLLIRL